MRHIALIASLAGLLVALPAQARPGHGHGHGQQAGEQRSANNNQRRCARMHRRAFVAAGQFVSFTASTDTADSANTGDVVVNVRRANRHARSTSNPRTFSTSGARVRLVGVTDGNSDAVVDLADARAGDRVKLIGKVVSPRRGCEGERSVVLRKVQVKRPEPPSGD